MKSIKSIILVAAIALSFSSCKNLVPYTDAMRQNHNWTPEQVKSIQFYVSQDVILHRELQKGSTDIVAGKIKTVDGRKVDEVKILAGTPGVVAEIPREDKLKVRFEASDENALSFGVNPNKGEKYVLLASEWDNGMGKVHYAGNEYYTDPNSRGACLLVDLRKVNKMDVKSRVAKGAKIK